MQKPTQKLKDIRVRALEFSVKLIRFVESLPSTAISQILIKQLIRAGTSIGANVVEAFGSGSKRDFTHFFTIALKSAKETVYWLYIFKATGRGKSEQVDLLIAEAQELIKIIAAIILTSKGKR